MCLRKLTILTFFLSIFLFYSLVRSADATIWSDTIYLCKSVTSKSISIRQVTNTESYSVNVEVSYTSGSNVSLLEYYCLSGGGVHFVVIKDGTVVQAENTYTNLPSGETLSFDVEAKPVSTISSGDTATVEVKVEVAKAVAPPPPYFPPIPYMRLDMVIEKPVTVSYLWFHPAFTAEVLVINRGTLADDVTFKWTLLDEDNVKVASGSEVLFISGLDKKTVCFDVPTPDQPGSYTLTFESTAPVRVEAERHIQVLTPFYGAFWFTLLVLVVAVLVTVYLFFRRK